MNKTNELDNLFTEWEEKVNEYKNKFVSDGIIDENEYDNADKKLLFIAKEPNDPLQERKWDFRDIWKNKIEFNNSFSYRIAEWAYGILNDFPPYDDLWSNDPSKLFNILQSISFMNLKKIGGNGSSEYDSIHKHVNNELDFLKKQIDIIRPEIIILGLSFWSDIRNIIFQDAEWTRSGYNIEIAKWKNIKIIDFYHPSSRNAPAASYSLLQNIVNSNIFKNLLIS